MQIHILTLFPQMFVGPFDYSIVKRASQKGLVTIKLTNIRDFATDEYKSVDDHPYGGGQGMIMRVDVIDRAIESVKGKSEKLKTKIILLDPTGIPYSQAKARKLAELEHLILVCGHYEGVDERVRSLVDEQISVGDYITTGGELPAMVVVDSVVRLLPGVLRTHMTSLDESFSLTRLEYPQYTQPQEYRGLRVPKVLLSGNHQKIADWQKVQSRQRTSAYRPDLLTG